MSYRHSVWESVNTRKSGRRMSGSLETHVRASGSNYKLPFLKMYVSIYNDKFKCKKEVGKNVCHVNTRQSGI